MKQKVLHRTNYFLLLEQKTLKKKPVYIIRLHTFLEYHDLKLLREIIDPFNNTGGTNHWRFRSRKQAEHMFTLLLLHWN